MFLRRNVFSIAAVILALAAGLVLGSHWLDGPAPWSGWGERNRAEALAARVDRLTAEANAADAFIAGSSGRVLGGTLSGRGVLLFTTPDADRGDVDAVAKALTTAGASIGGTVGLTGAFVDSGQGDRLRTAATNLIPAGGQLRGDTIDQGGLAGDLLGLAFLVDPGSGQQRSTPEERALILDTLRAGGFVTAGDVQPAQLAVVVTGDGAGDGDQGSIVARFADALRGRGAGVVLAGRAGSATGAGAIAAVRADGPAAHAVTTVDNVDREIGRVTTALGLSEQLNGGSGRYGTGPDASSLSVIALPR
ncbi:copper transporter [Nocardia sp. NPDC004068]|uniref:copper transporter n=1 Tax=Nocardia sp. NPDC004068 TaxID=3364303 RepID=UPI0036A7D40B